MATRIGMLKNYEPPRNLSISILPVTVSRPPRRGARSVDVGAGGDAREKPRDQASPPAARGERLPRVARRRGHQAADVPFNVVVPRLELVADILPPIAHALRDSPGGYCAQIHVPMCHDFPFAQD